MITSKTDQDLPVYSDDSIQSEIWKKVCQYGEIRALDMDSFSVSVKKGFVLLTGHVSKKYHRDLIAEIAFSMPGVHAVHNNLVVDSDLIIQVAQALSKDERTRSLILPVGCSHGWIRLGGEVPTHELQLVAEDIAGQVPSVRGIVSLPKAPGDSCCPERHAVQPQIQTKIYDYNKHEGLVSQVVIQPRNRLVTHVVVNISDFCEGKFMFHEYLVPVEAMELVNKESILLKRNEPPLDAFPAFEPLDYPLAPSDWQPPYPYAAGDVRWPCELSYDQNDIRDEQ